MSLEQIGGNFNKNVPSDQMERVPSADARLEVTRSTADTILGKLEAIPEAEEYTDISKMYRDLPSQDLIVRRENPEKLMHLLIDHQPLSIEFVGNTPYANSVAWNPKIDGNRGLDNAIMEGYGHMDNVVMVYGFEKPEGFYLEQLPESSQVFAGIDRVRVRSASGFVPAESVRFVTVRVPIKGFPLNRMTEEEQDELWEYTETAEKSRAPKFIYRGYVFTKEEAAHLKMAA